MYEYEAARNWWKSFLLDWHVGISAIVSLYSTRLNYNRRVGSFPFFWSILIFFFLSSFSYVNLFTSNFRTCSLSDRCGGRRGRLISANFNLPPAHSAAAAAPSSRHPLRSIKQMFILLLLYFKSKLISSSWWRGPSNVRPFYKETAPKWLPVTTRSEGGEQWANSWGWTGPAAQ